MRPFGCPVTILNTIDHLGSGPNWLFDIDALTKSKNYKPVVAWNQSNGSAGTKACDNAGKANVETEEEKKDAKDPGNEDSKVLSIEESRVNQEKDASVNNTNTINTVSPTVNAAGIKDNVVDENIVYGCVDDPNMPELEEIGIFSDVEDDNSGADMNNLDTYFQVSPVPTTIIHKHHPLEQVIGDLHSAPQIRRMTKNLEEHGFLRTKWVFRNKKDERGIVIKNKARLVTQGYTQEEGIDYDEVFAPVAKTESIRLFLAYAPFKDFVVYQKGVKSAFLYGKIKEEVYVCQPLGFEDPYFLDRVYKVEKALYRLHQAPRAWYETLSTYLLDNGFHRGKIDKTLFIKRDKSDILLVQVYVDDIIFRSTRKKMCTEFEKMMHKKFHMSSMGELTFFLGLQVKQKEDGIFISQDKYVTEILKKFSFSDVKTASTPMETHKSLLKDVDVCACARFQVNPKISHLHAVKRIFRYLKGQSKLGLWYPKDSPFDLVAYTNSDYAGASLDRKSTTRAEYIAASNCCGQVLWIQNQLLDYGYNFMQTKIHIDNESTICIVKNPVFHSKTKHIEIRHHFIRDSNEKKLIQMIKIHTDQNVADLLTKAFDRIIHKGWLEWNAKAAKDGIGVKTGNSRVNAVGHYLVLLGKKNVNFAKIVDFLNANLIRYALTVSPTIYVSCIEQFWSTAKTKTVNNETQIHAKVEGKTIIISESSVRRDLQFDDQDGIACLTNT
ncbi:putative ribonuclease H-like domain-containing protein [Tanacetum coccineum]